MMVVRDPKEQCAVSRAYWESAVRVVRQAASLLELHEDVHHFVVVVSDAVQNGEAARVLVALLLLLGGKAMVPCIWGVADVLERVDQSLQVVRVRRACLRPLHQSDVRHLFRCLVVGGTWVRRLLLLLLLLLLHLSVVTFAALVVAVVAVIAASVTFFLTDFYHGFFALMIII